MRRLVRHVAAVLPGVMAREMGVGAARAAHRVPAVMADGEVAPGGYGSRSGTGECLGGSWRRAESKERREGSGLGRGRRGASASVGVRCGVLRAYSGRPRTPWTCRAARTRPCQVDAGGEMVGQRYQGDQ